MTLMKVFKIRNRKTGEVCLVEALTTAGAERLAFAAHFDIEPVRRARDAAVMMNAGVQFMGAPAANEQQGVQQ